MNAATERCDHIGGPLYHGTRSELEVGDELPPATAPTSSGPGVHNIYFAALVATADWGAELATALNWDHDRRPCASCAQPLTVHSLALAPTGPRPPPVANLAEASVG